MDRLRRDGTQGDTLSDEELRFVESIRKFTPHIGDELIRSAFEIALRAFPRKREE